MKCLIDQYIPYLAEVLQQVGEVVCLPPEEITPARLTDVDALFVRTRTKVNRALLDGSRVQFVASATIGFDHINTPFCESRKITWTACPGCNAEAVTDYVQEALLTLERNQVLSKPFANTTLCIVGLGHVGSLVQQMAQQLGMRILISDPPKGYNEPLEDLARQSDILTFHTPLTSSGDFPTYHLGNEHILSSLPPSAVVINAARGGIVDEQALLRSGHACVMDCWENEPNISLDLLHSPHTLLASYHIAGYSQLGKWNATRMCLEAFSRHFGVALPPLEPAHTASGDKESGWLSRVTEQLRATPNDFEYLRQHYPLR